MIIGFMEELEKQAKYIKIGHLNNIFEIIRTSDFSKLDDGIFRTGSEDFFYILMTYKTSRIFADKPAEAHRKYIDLQYIVYGEEKVGYADYRNNKKISKEYDESTDAELFERVEDESFVILKKDMYSIFFPEDIHRTGLNNNETRSIRKLVFKIAV